MLWGFLGAFDPELGKSRMKTYIKDLVDLGLVEDEINPKLTQKGIQYLREYERVLDFVKRMGLSYR